MSTSPEPKNLLSRFVTACLLFLVAVVALVLAFDLLAKIWLGLVLAAVVVGVAAAAIWIVRGRQNRW